MNIQIRRLKEPDLYNVLECPIQRKIMTLSPFWHFIYQVIIALVIRLLTKQQIKSKIGADVVSARVKNNKVETGLNINVLVVDDNQINRLLINKVLKKWGATADFAENGQEAIDKLELNQNFDVVLMDIHMPVMGGLEATGAIRSKSESYFQQLPIIALTASMLSNQMGEIKHAGMNDYILKPFDPATLFEKLSRYQKQ